MPLQIVRVCLQLFSSPDLSRFEVRCMGYETVLVQLVILRKLKISFFLKSHLFKGGFC
jgi:hypothetical protein